MRLIIVTLLAVLGITSHAQAVSFDCYLDWKPAPPCSGGHAKETPYMIYKITPVKGKPSIYTVKKTVHNVDLYCGSEKISEGYVQVTKRRVSPYTTSRKYQFSELTIFREKGVKVLEAELPLYNHAYPTGTCTIR